MKYDKVVKGLFLERPNRFIAKVLVDGKEEICHVRNTGRCKEILVNGKTVVYLEDCIDKPGRKTRYSLIAAVKGDRLINIDSQIPNAAAFEFIKQGRIFNNLVCIKREVTYSNSRFDIYLEYKKGDIIKKAFVEVKGVTLETDGVVSFPDAPSVRAVKHLRELVNAIDDGYEAYVLFVVQMKDVKYFTPNELNHKEFADTLRYASENNVHVLAYDCYVNNDEIYLNEKVKVKL